MGWPRRQLGPRRQARAGGRVLSGVVRVHDAAGLGPRLPPRMRARCDDGHCTLHCSCERMPMQSALTERWLPSLGTRRAKRARALSAWAASRTCTRLGHLSINHCQHTPTSAHPPRITRFAAQAPRQGDTSASSSGSPGGFAAAGVDFRRSNHQLTTNTTTNTNVAARAHDRGGHRQDGRRRRRQQPRRQEAEGGWCVCAFVLVCGCAGLAGMAIPSLPARLWGHRQPMGEGGGAGAGTGLCCALCARLARGERRDDAPACLCAVYGLCL